jgi:hypothetical protein
MVATKDLKIATKQDQSQTKVWKKVEAAQERLSAGVAREVRSDVSESSLQLALENEKVQQSAAAYVNKLASIVEGKGDVTGFAFTINNKLNSADVYASTEMFKRFWPKLLKAAVIKAIAERTSDKGDDAVSISALEDLFVAAERGMESVNAVTTRTHMLKREGEKSLFFETRDMAHNAAWIHRSYLMK